MTDIIEVDLRAKLAAPGVVRTDAFDMIAEAISRTKTSPWLGPALVIGAPGTGKSTALQALIAKPSRLITWDPTVTTLRHGLEHIADALETSRPAAWFTAREIRRLCVNRARSLHAYAQPDGIIIAFDECQFMSLELLETVRTIWDLTNVPMLFAGNDQFRGQITKKRFEAFFSRLGLRCHLPPPEPGDVAALCRCHKIAGAREHDLLSDIAARVGELRTVVKVLRLARDLGGPDKPVRVEQLREAAASLGLE